MRNRKISKAARQFRALVQTNTPCYDTLTAYMESLGWVVIEYGDGGKGDAQLEALGISDYAEGVKAFFYTSKAFRVIAVSALEPKAERLDLLRHEIGHIVLKHDPEQLTVKADAEASMFALYLQSEMHRPPRRWLPWAICAALALCSLCLLLWGFWGKPAAPAASPAAAPSTRARYCAAPGGNSSSSLSWMTPRRFVAVSTLTVICQLCGVCPCHYCSPPNKTTSGRLPAASNCCLYQ